NSLPTVARAAFLSRQCECWTAPRGGRRRCTLSAREATDDTAPHERTHDAPEPVCIRLRPSQRSLAASELVGRTAGGYPLLCTTWKVSCNPLNLRKQFAEGFSRTVFI